MTTASSKKTAVLYARYSSDMQKATSIDGQLLLCRKVALRNDLDVIGEFVDAAKSGLTEGARDGYQRLLNGVRNRDFDVVVVEHFDRLSRDPATIQRLKQVFEFNGVELMDQKGSMRPPLTSASQVSTTRFTSRSSPKRFGAAMTTLLPTEEFLAHAPMVIGRGRARRANA